MRLYQSKAIRNSLTALAQRPAPRACLPVPLHLPRPLPCPLQPSRFMWLHSPAWGPLPSRRPFPLGVRRHLPVVASSATVGVLSCCTSSWKSTDIRTSETELTEMLAAERSEDTDGRVMLKLTIDMWCSTTESVGDSGLMVAPKTTCGES